MIKKLRRKFVIVTMLLLVSTFSILLIAEYYLSEHWDKLDTLQTLEWLADSGSFNEIIKHDSSIEDRNPVYAITFNEAGDIIKVGSTLGSKNNSDICRIAKEIYNTKHTGYQWKSFIYTFRDLDQGKHLLVLTKRNNLYETPLEFLGEIVIYLIGFLLLLAVCIYLSRFITKPAEKALEREKQFISDASHELKTPIAAISINAQALKGQIEDNIHLQHILSETNRMDKLIRRLLLLSALEEKETSLEKANFSMSDACEEIALTMDTVAYEKGIQFDYEIDDNIFYNGNSDEIKQLLTILLDNAIKHTPESGLIRLKLMGHSHPILSVFNTGIGISKEDLPHIFERFYSLEKSRSNSSGSFGLGLSIAKAIVIAHNGTIDVTSVYGKNACFTVKL